MISSAISSNHSGTRKWETSLANIEPRLLQLFEVLVEAGADWLIFELVEGIGAGSVLEESADDLAKARFLARQDREPRRTAERVAVSPQSHPIEGDKQIIWAARDLGDRLQNTLDMMEASIERMERLVNGDRAKISLETRSGVTLSLQVGEGAAKVTVGDRSAAQSAVQDLFAALEVWVGEATDGR